MNINKFTNNLDNTPFHSNGYAEVAAGSAIGSVSPQPFSQRRHLERNRQVIGGYRTSRIANGYDRSTQYERGSPSSSRSGSEPVVRRTGEGAGRPLSGSLAPQARRQFTEPPTRSYNPYK